MTVFHFGGKPEQTHEQFFQRLIEDGNASPDPGWDYADLWATTMELSKCAENLRMLIAQTEQQSAEADQQIQERLQLIESVIHRAKAHFHPPVQYKHRESLSDFGYEVARHEHR